MNQAIEGQPLSSQILPQNLPQNVNIYINKSFDNLTADQKYEILTKGTEDPFVRAPRTINQTINQEIQLSTDIISGSLFP